MSSRFRLGALSLTTVAFCLLVASAASAQGVLRGKVTDLNGAAIEGITVRAENPDAAPSSRSVETNENGEYVLVGLRSGVWTITFEGEGWITSGAQRNISAMSRNDPLNAQLEPGIVAPEGEEFDAAEIQGELDAASAMVSAGDYDGAIAAYEALSERLPDLTALRLQIASVYSQKGDHDASVAEYDAVLAKEPNNMRAKMGRATTLLAGGKMDEAEAALTEMVAQPNATADMHYQLGEVKFAKGDADGAAAQYEEAAAANPTWGKPLFKLALVAINKADSATATTYLEKVIEVDPGSQEAGQAKLIIEQLRQQ